MLLCNSLSFYFILSYLYVFRNEVHKKMKYEARCPCHIYAKLTTLLSANGDSGGEGGGAVGRRFGTL